LLLVGVAVSTVVFSFGNILEPAVKLLLEGESPYWSLLMAFRKYAPAYLILGFFVGGLLPGIVTGLMVVKGDSLIHRLQYALFWSPISLSFFDAIAYVLLWQSDVLELRALANWGNVYFSLLSNIFGGMAGGLIIGSVIHLFVETAYKDHLPSHLGQA
jgi:hypothetical protein